MTLIEKIIADHTDEVFEVGGMVELGVDTRVARDFGGANVVSHLEKYGLPIENTDRTFFTFDCNPTGSDQGYTANQHKCRVFARKHGFRVFDINRGIGTHVVLEEALIDPGGTLVSTDSHANILGAVSAFGQGMGDLDIAHAFAYGSVWFKVPPTVLVRLEGQPSEHATAKDLTLAVVRHFGSRGLLGCAAEFTGPAIEALDLAGRITLASMATEMGAIILFPRFSESAAQELSQMSGHSSEWPLPDEDADYFSEVVIDLDGLEPLVSRPGHPEDVVPVSDLEGEPIDSSFIGSCTNGRIEDLREAAAILKNRKIAEGHVLKIVPATDQVWMQALDEGLIEVFKTAGVLVSNCGCAGCAEGQVGQTGPGENTVSTGNRNFPGKQGLGSVYLASPATAAASAITGVLVAPHRLGSELIVKTATEEPAEVSISQSASEDDAPETTDTVEYVDRGSDKPAAEVEGNVWILDIDSLDTDMIYHNRHLSVTEIDQMGQYALGNVPGWEDFPQKASHGDILVVGANFGAGSSRQHAVDCFRALGIGAIIGASFGAIYERNAINAGFPILVGDLRILLHPGDRVRVDLERGNVERLLDNTVFEIAPMTPIQLRIYRRGGLLSSH